MRRERMRAVVADDERPARSLLVALLSANPDVEVIGQAASGTEAVELIERERPDLAFLDLQMPELDGLGVVRLVRKDRAPLVVFVTAFDAYAVAAFELNAVDYLLKPVEPARLREALNRAQERLERADLRERALDAVETAADSLERLRPLARIPVKKRDRIVLVPVEQIASIVADGELLHLHTVKGERHTITYRLKDLEPRLVEPEFLRLSRGTLVNVGLIDRIAPMPGGTYTVTLTTGQELPASRIQSRVLKEKLLKL